MNNPEKILTIIVPAFDMEALLPRCLESLLVSDNRMPELEVVVVNDGSHDRTGEIAHGFANRHPGIFRVVDKANGNYGSCINAALPLASGLYVKVLDADDSVDKAAFERLIAVLEEEATKGDSAADLVVTDYVSVNPEGTILHRTGYRFPEGLGHDLSEMDDGDARFTIHSIVYRRSVFDTIGYRQTEGMSYTDTEWIVEPMVRVRRVRYLPVPVTKYLVGRSGQTMEAETYAARFQQVADITLGLAGRFEERLGQCVPEASAYYERQVLRMIGSVYHACLFGVGGCRVRCDLGAFDRALRAVPRLYEASGGIRFPSTRLPLRYVRAWRKGGLSRSSVLLLLRTFLRLKKTKRKTATGKNVSSGTSGILRI